MSPVRIFLIRAVLSVVAGLILSAAFFGGIRLYLVVMLAALMLGVAYVMEALRKRTGFK